MRFNMKLRIVSYNTQSGFAIGRKKYDHLAQAKHLESLSPDIIALQEVAIRHPHGEPVNYPAEVAKYLKFNYVFGKALELGKDGEYGVAVMSKFPLREVTKLFLPVPGNIEPRIALIVKVLAPEPFYMISTHLSYQGEFPGDDTGRIDQIKMIMDHVEENRLFPAILAGDLNSAPQDDSINALREKFNVFSDDTEIEPTCETKFGPLQIDFISGAPIGRFHCQKIQAGDDQTVSDHRAVIADVEF